MKLYKLTDEKGQTYGGTQWGNGVTHTATGNVSGGLCSDAYIHAYTDPLLAVLLNPIHANFTKPQLWEAEGEVTATDHGLKVGCRSLTTVKRLPLPRINKTQRTAFGILCAKAVCHDPVFNRWADEWLSGEDRSRAAADAAAAEAREAAAAAWAASAAAWAAPPDLIAIARKARGAK